MSNNAPDYENDLVFPSQEIKSQDELAERGRKSDVLIAALEKCEKLEKKNHWLKALLKECRPYVEAVKNMFEDNGSDDDVDLVEDLLFDIEEELDK